jgi:crotonobetainyl-CoA:carnitine CoA-transferase CaiB-like acyl-CoA transferase
MLDIDVDVEAAAAGMRASRYIKREDDTGAPLAGNRQITADAGGGGLPLFQDRNGRWIYFQREFQNHRDITAAVLQCEYENEALAKAIGQWDAFELEDAVVAAGATAGVVRSYEEWAQHPQAQALKKLPLFDIVRMGDSKPEPLAMTNRPLGGVRVVDQTRVIAGPTAARTLAEHGANVMHVGLARLPENASQYLDGGHGKRAVELDIDTPEGAETLRRLIREADVFSQSIRPGSLAARGFSPEALAELRPGIVMLSLSAFGREGPWAQRRGFDSVVQACSGICDELATDGRPRFAPANPLDYATGYIAAFGIMTALRRRAIEGGSYHVRVSLAQTGRWLTGMSRVPASEYAAQPNDLSAERLASLMVTSDTPAGRLSYIAPIAMMSETAPRWDLPTAPIGHDKAAW